MIIPVILSGGSGTRLWPLSRQAFPKQFLHLTKAGSLFQATISRLRGLPGCGPPLVICNEDHRFLVAEQVRLLAAEVGAILLEPMPRNTAPAAACAALMAAQPDAVLLVLPADHLIHDTVAFHQALMSGLGAAQAGRLVTFGIVPEKPETGYGYIRRGHAWDVEEPHAESRVFEVAAFFEKPDVETARGYVASGEYYWNSGLFMFRADVYLEELGRLAPEMVASCRKSCSLAVRDLDFLRLDQDSFAACPEDSIDYAVMEKTGHAVVAPMDVGWNDVGAWSALWDVGQQDESGNVTSGDVMLSGVRDAYVRAESRLVAAIGVSDQVIVETADAVFVAAKDRVQEVKAIVQRLKKAGRKETVHHRKVYRPWGAYESIDVSERFQVKRITVNPGSVLSLQLHHHRAEHWVVVRGTARVTRGKEVFTLSEDQSTYIPLGVQHRLENPGRIPLELIEVQTGSYLGEDDIVRFEDRYGRTEKSQNQTIKPHPA